MFIIFYALSFLKAPTLRVMRIVEDLMPRLG